MNEYPLTYFSELNYNIIVPSAPTSPNRLLPFAVNRTKFCMLVHLHLSHACQIDILVYTVIILKLFDNVICNSLENIPSNKMRR
jgi:hypothetical protein